MHMTIEGISRDITKVDNDFMDVMFKAYENKTTLLTKTIPKHAVITDARDYLNHSIILKQKKLQKE